MRCRTFYTLAGGVMKNNYTQAETDAFYAQRLYILTADARFNWRGSLVVDWCPYCGEQHIHDLPINTNLIGLRLMSGCDRSEYSIELR